MVFAMFTVKKHNNTIVSHKPQGLDLDELEGSFLETLESRKKPLKSSNKSTQWMSRAVFSLSEIRDKIFERMVCGSDTTCVEQHEDNHIKHIKSVSMRKNSAVIAPAPVVLAPLLSSQKLQLSDICEQQQEDVQEAQEALKKLEVIRKIQHIFRQRHSQHSSSSTASTCSMDSLEEPEFEPVEEQEQTPEVETKRLHTLFKRVRLVFQFVSMLKDKSHKRQAAVIAIQRQWRLYQQEQQQQKPVLWVAADVCFPVRQSKKRSRSEASEESEMVEYKKYCIRSEAVEYQQQQQKHVEEEEEEEEEADEMEVEDDDLDFTFYQKAYYRQQQEQFQKEKMDVAACLIQSIWRRALASQHVRTLRAIDAFEKETESLMPTIRTRMTSLRQRLYLMRAQKYDDLL